MTKILLIINPVSGRQKARTILYRIIDHLCRNNCKITIFITKGRGDATEIVKDHGAEHDKIICCGGDGTLNEVFTGIVSSGFNLPVGYIPTGTSNDFARSLGLKNNSLKSTLDITLHGKEQYLDIGTFNTEKYFSYVTAFGAFSKAAYGTPQWLKNHVGRVSYFFYGLSELADIRPYYTKIIADDIKIEGDFVLGAISNSTVFGSMPIYPERSIVLDDGKFEILLVKPVKSPKNLQDILQGILMHEYNEDSVIVLTASQITILFEEKAPWTIDGEYAGELNSVQISNIHRSAKVLIPNPQAASERT